MVGQSSPMASAWLVIFWITPRLILRLSRIWRMLRPADNLNLKTSLSFRIDSLLVGITFPVTKRKRLAGQYQCRNQDSGIVNADSGVNAKSFTINQNQCSRSTRMGVHDGAQSAFTLGQNTHSAPWSAILKKKNVLFQIIAPNLSHAIARTLFV